MLAAHPTPLGPVDVRSLICCEILDVHRLVRAFVNTEFGLSSGVIGIVLVLGSLPLEDPRNDDVLKLARHRSIWVCEPFR